MSNEIKVISATGLSATDQTQIVQHGNDSIPIPNYGTINMTIQQQFAAMPSFGGNFYVPVRVSREYYNINRSDTFNNGLHFVDKSIDCE